MFRDFCRTSHCFIASLILSGGAAASPAAVTYHFAPDQRMIYDVKITAQLPEGEQVISGHAFYVVKSVENPAWQATINFFTDLHITHVSSRTPTPFMRQMPSFFMASPAQTIAVDQLGRVVRYAGEDQLPYLLGNAWNLALAPAPAAKNEWQTDQSVELDRRLGRFPVPWFADSQEHRSAEETCDYRVSSRVNSQTTVEKTYELTADETVDGQPILREAGNGEIVFDNRTGWVQSENIKYQIAVHQNGALTEFPVTVQVTLLDRADADQIWQVRQSVIAKADQERAEREKPKWLDNQTLDDALLKLKSEDPWRVQEACEQLEHAIVVKTRQLEVAGKLEPLLKSSQEMVRMAGAKALGVWASKPNIPKLSEAVESGDVFLRNEAIKALSHIHDTLAADEIAKQLPNFRTRSQAEEALINMGPVAEPAVIPLLKDPDWTTRLSACKILAAIGTQQSIPALQDLSGAEHNNLVNMSADKAVDAIRQRIKP